MPILEPPPTDRSVLYRVSRYQIANPEAFPVEVWPADKVAFRGTPANAVTLAKSWCESDELGQPTCIVEYLSPCSSKPFRFFKKPDGRVVRFTSDVVVMGVACA